MKEHKKLNIKEFSAQFFNAEHSKEFHRHTLLSALLEYWATERDYEIKNQLLNGLMVKYTDSIRKLVELNQLKNKFLGMAAHDLRNPLASIRGLSELMLAEVAGPMTEDQKEYLKVIHTASNGMLKLVNDLLDVSVIESGRLELQVERGSLVDLVRERVRIHRVVAEEKGITLHEHLSEIADQRFDSYKIAQVIDNLISNAIKFSPHGSNIYVTAIKEGAVARVSVRDEGPGIPQEDMERIFGDFQRLRTKTTAGEKSTGLGLAIAKRIIEAHRGALAVESEGSGGTTFSFTLLLGYDTHGDEETKSHNCR